MLIAKYGWLKNYRVAFAWGILILILSLIPGRYLPAVREFYLLFQPDKLMHLWLFGTMSYFILYGMHKQEPATGKSIYGIIIALITAIVLGAFAEYLQFILPLKRSGNIYDFLANVNGSLLGVMTFSVINRKKRKKSDAS